MRGLAVFHELVGMRGLAVFHELEWLRGLDVLHRASGVERPCCIP